MPLCFSTDCSDHRVTTVALSLNRNISKHVPRSPFRPVTVGRKRRPAVHDGGDESTTNIINLKKNHFFSPTFHLPSINLLSVAPLSFGRSVVIPPVAHIGRAAFRCIPGRHRVYIRWYLYKTRYVHSYMNIDRDCESHGGSSLTLIDNMIYIQCRRSVCVKIKAPTIL